MRNILRSGAICAVSLFIVGVSFAQDAYTGTPEEICEAAVPAKDPEIREYDAPEQVIEPNVDYRAIFCTEAGPIYVDLFEDQAPVTVNSFVFLAQNDFYNNITFHRVLADFMAQGGDPTGTGTGGPGYQFQDEFSGYLRFDRPGLLAMANAGAGTNGSQFFLTTVVTSHLDFRHTIFGEVLSGQDNLDNLRLRDPQTDTQPGAALDTVVIITSPDDVEVDFETPQRVTVEDFEAVLADLPELPGVELRERTGIYLTDDLIGTQDRDLQENYQAFLEAHHHQFTTLIAHENVACDLDTAPFEIVGYRIHVFESSKDAAAALTDEYFSQFLGIPEDADTSFSEMLPNPVYTWNTTACDVDGIAALTYMKDGRFVMVAESTYPADEPFTADLWLAQVVRYQLYEAIFYDVLRAATSGG